MIDPRAFIGAPILFKNICKIYPPTVGQIINNPLSQRYINLLTQNREDIINLFESTDKNYKGDGVDPFQFLLLTANQNKNVKTLITDAIKFFVHEEVCCLPEQQLFYIGDLDNLSKATSPEDIPCLTAENFLDFQNCIRLSLGLQIETNTPPEEEDNPIIRRVRAMSRRRQRAARKNSSSKGLTLDTTLSALCCMNMGLNPINIVDLPYASIQMLTSMYQAKEKYETDIRTIQAGGNPKKIHPKYWIKNNERENEVLLDSDKNGTKKI